MARAQPNAPSSRSRKRSRLSRRPRASPPLTSRKTSLELLALPRLRDEGEDLRRLDVVLQRFLLAFEFLDAPFDDVADRDQAGQFAALQYRQMPEFSGRHLFH